MAKRIKNADGLPGESTEANLRRWQDYASRNSYKTGGAVKGGKFTGGAQSGVGRLEKAAHQRRKG